jgi:hypothetical protein
MSAIDAIAGKLIEAAYERFGRPPDPGGEYIETVTRDTDVAAYFREMVKLAAAPRSKELRESWWAIHDQDAAMVMEAGFDHLLTDAALPPEERRIMEGIKALKAWVIEEEHMEMTELQDALMAEIEAGGSLAEKLVPAARDYIGAALPELSSVMEGDTVAAYFRAMVDLAKQPRTLEVWRRYQTEVYKREPEFVMEAGIAKLLADATLPEEERRLIEEVTAFEAWASDLANKLTQ